MRLVRNETGYSFEIRIPGHQFCHPMLTIQCIELDGNYSNSEQRGVSGGEQGGRSEERDGASG